MSAVKTGYLGPLDPILHNRATNLIYRMGTSAIDCSKYAISIFSRVSTSSAPPSTTTPAVSSTADAPSHVSTIAHKLVKLEPFQSLESARKKALCQRHKIPSRINTSPYDLSDAQYLPGLTNVFFAPKDFFNGIKASKDSRSKKDTETRIDSTLRIFQTPFAFIYGACASYIDTIIIFQTFLPELISCLTLFNTIFSKVTFILGLALTVIELVIEIPGLCRSIVFSQNIMFSIEGIIKKLKENRSPKKQKQIISDLIQKFKKNKKSLILKYGYLGYNDILKTLISYEEKHPRHQLTKSDIAELEAKLLYHALESFKRKNLDATPSHVEKIMGASPHLTKEHAEFISKEINLKNLSKRIHQWATDRAHNDIEKILDSLKSSDPSTRRDGVKKAYELIGIIRTQNIKKIFTYFIGFIAIALSTLSLIFTLIFLFNPAVFPVIATAVLVGKVIFWASFVAGIVSGAANQGFMSCEGWHFSVKKALPKMPQRVKNLFQKLKTVSIWKAKKPLSARSIRALPAN